MSNSTLTIDITELSTVENLAQILAIASPKQAWYYFSGDLGAGKTTFIRAFLQACGIQGAIRSPTFTLVEAYQNESTKFYHFDCYRLNDPQELSDIGARDYFGEQSLCLLEWPEKVASLLPEPDLHFQLQMSGRDRQLIIQSLSGKGAEILAVLGTQMETAR